MCVKELTLHVAELLSSLSALQQHDDNINDQIVLGVHDDTLPSGAMPQ